MHKCNVIHVMFCKEKKPQVYIKFSSDKDIDRCYFDLGVFYQTQDKFDNFSVIFMRHQSFAQFNIK